MSPTERTPYGLIIPKEYKSENDVSTKHQMCADEFKQMMDLIKRDAPSSNKELIKGIADLNKGVADNGYKVISRSTAGDIVLELVSIKAKRKLNPSFDFCMKGRDIVILKFHCPEQEIAEKIADAMRPRKLSWLKSMMGFEVTAKQDEYHIMKIYQEDEIEKTYREGTRISPSPLHPGRHIRHALEAKGITTQEFSIKAGIDLQEVEKVSSGTIIPNNEFFEKSVECELISSEAVEYWRIIRDDYCKNYGLKIE